MGDGVERRENLAVGEGEEMICELEGKRIAQPATHKDLISNMTRRNFGKMLKNFYSRRIIKFLKFRKFKNSKYKVLTFPR